MITLESCPVCKGEKFIKKLTCKDHSNSLELFTIVSCETCGFMFTNPRPSEKNLKKYYKSGEYISHTNNKKGVFNSLYQVVRKYSIKRKLRLLKTKATKGNHLDIGCGTGEFLNACNKEGFSARGIEPSKLAREQAIKNYNLDVSSDVNLKQYSTCEFDSISMWHVLEHVSNLEDTLTEIKRIQKKDGILIVAVPNCNSWDATYYKEFWAAWDVPIHLWHFTIKTIEILEQKNLGQKKINFRLKDWGISRQRYWGCPIPIAYNSKNEAIKVPLDQLPIKLPENINLKTTGNPLDKQDEWKKIFIDGKENRKDQTDG